MNHMVSNKIRKAGVTFWYSFVILLALAGNLIAEPAGGQQPGPRVFIGLATGGLEANSEAHLRAYIKLHEIARRVDRLVRVLLGTASPSVVVAELAGEKNIDDEINQLAGRRYTHFIIASTESLGFTRREIAVSWIVGRFLPSDQIMVELKERTVITVPDGKGEPTLTSMGPTDTRGSNLEEIANRLASLVLLVSPELKVKYYLIDCFENRIEASGWKDLDAWAMMQLWVDLEEMGAWEPSRRIVRRADAQQLCQVSRGERDISSKVPDYQIGGWFTDTQLPGGQRRVQAHINLYDTLLDKLRELANVSHAGGRNPHPKIEDFCIEVTGAEKKQEVVNGLVRYVKVRGLKVGNASDVHAHICR
jgi:hypothetical protein